VRTRIDPPDSLLALAARQAGTLSAGQALAQGLPRAGIERLVDQGAWQRLTPGVFLLGVGEPSCLARAWAGTLVGGDRSRLGFAAAGHLWGIVDDAPPTISVLVPWSTVIGPRGSWTFPRERPGVRQARSPGEPARTTIEDTVLDLCADAAPGDLAGLVTKAIQTQRTTARQLLACIEQRARLTNRALLRDVLDDVADGAESPLELRYLRDVERRHQLPPARRQYRAARRRAVRDLRYDEFGLLIELDGRTHIAGRFRDMRRDNGALLDGEVTLRYGWDDVTGRPCQVAWEVAQLLSQRGWSGLPVRCSWCSEAPVEDLIGA
jgi:very-short-patch-repair endonuclease